MNKNTFVLLSLLTVLTLGFAEIASAEQLQTMAFPALIGGAVGVIVSGDENSLSAVDGDCFCLSPFEEPDNPPALFEFAFGVINVPWNATDLDLSMYSNYTGNCEGLTLYIYNWTVNDGEGAWQALLSGCENCHEFTWHNCTIDAGDGSLTDFMQWQTDGAQDFGNLCFFVADHNADVTDILRFDCITVTAEYPT